MGEYKMEEMSLLALFEQARKIHLAASESGADQVRSSTNLVMRSFFLPIYLCSDWTLGRCEEGL